MYGGCISIWQKDSLNDKNKKTLEYFAYYISIISIGYSIRFKEISIKSKPEKAKILDAIGYLPSFEILICGFSDAIFLSAESILHEFGGYLKLGVGATKEELRTLKGKHFLISRSLKTNFYY